MDSAIAEVATRSHGVVTRAELATAGVRPAAIRERIGRGALIRVHRGVYRAGHAAPSREADYLAAVRACGAGAALAGRAAGHLWGLIKGSPPPPEVIARTARRVPGVAVSRDRAVAAIQLGPRRVTTRLRIPVTTVPRTLVDLASCLPEPQLARACHEAGVLQPPLSSRVGAGPRA